MKRVYIVEALGVFSFFTRDLSQYPNHHISIKLKQQLNLLA
jgi:hypothetical protein